MNRGYLLAAGPETPVAQIFVATNQRNPERNLGADLCRIVAWGLEQLPRRFTCEGNTVGLWEVIEGSLCVRGPVALSCLSWALRDRKVGFYLTVPELETD